MSTLRSLRAYAQFARCAFSRRTAYRLANWTGIIVNFFFFLIQAQVYLALFGSRPAVAGWHAADAVRYFATVQALLMVIGVLSAQPAIEFAERIRSGDVAVDLVRPVRLWARYLAESYGSAVYFAVTRASVLYVTAVLLYHVPPLLTAEMLLIPLSIALGIWITAVLMYAASATAFWTEQAHGPVSALVLALSFFGGMVVPLDFYPSAVRLVADVLPFRGAIYTPVALATGVLSGGALLFGLLHQVIWVVLLSAAASRIERRGTAQLAIHGG